MKTQNTFFLILSLILLVSCGKKGENCTASPSLRPSLRPSLVGASRSYCSANTYESENYETYFEYEITGAFSANGNVNKESSNGSAACTSSNGALKCSFLETVNNNTNFLEFTLPVFNKDQKNYSTANNEIDDIDFFLADKNQVNNSYYNENTTQCELKNITIVPISDFLNLYDSSFTGELDCTNLQSAEMVNGSPSPNKANLKLKFKALIVNQ